jgi:hypothetical protein
VPARGLSELSFDFADTILDDKRVYESRGCVEQADGFLDPERTVIKTQRAAE